MTVNGLTRRALVAGGAALAVTPALARRMSAGERVTNPLIRQRADAQIALQADGLHGVGPVLHARL